MHQIFLIYILIYYNDTYNDKNCFVYSYKQYIKEKQKTKMLIQIADLSAVRITI